MATLRLYADDLVPEDIQRIIRLKPDYAAIKGQGLLKRGDGRSITWFITTQLIDAGNKPEDHLGWVVLVACNPPFRTEGIIPDIQADLSLLVHDPILILRNSLWTL